MSTNFTAYALLGFGILFGLLSGIGLWLLADICRRPRNTPMPSAAAVDRLTGLPDRRALIDALAPISRAGKAATLAIVNLDQFAALNATFGYRAGDQVLVLLAAVLREAARNRGAGVYRLGRDEFALLWPRSDEHLTKDVKDLLARLREPFEVQLPGRTVVMDVTACAGMYAAPMCPITSTVLLRANSALQHAKAIGAGTVLSWTMGLPLRHRARDDRRCHAVIGWAAGTPTLIVGRDPDAVDRQATQIVADAVATWTGDRRSAADAALPPMPPGDAPAADQIAWTTAVLAAWSASYHRLTDTDITQAGPVVVPVSAARPREVQRPVGTPGSRRAA
ncbi:GGDEF domain-containing protein [Catellatospora sp. KI3]|uniref:GGDEF domain-containing protein n=1 Tax=Catellatospora sp. KI3 TaxID=3041620 RepID=UPI002483128B|nr:GGDEF domain-containing protein [Catellatospora sp. KI3]MDI1460998.1 GGDEF domain-containing protein [Catellatospora sp. KI3]